MGERITTGGIIPIKVKQKVREVIKRKDWLGL